MRNNISQLIYENVNRLLDVKRIAQKIADSLHCDRSGVCMYFVEKLTKALLEHGIDNFIIVEGYVKEINYKYMLQHTWIEYYGEKIDETFIQFTKMAGKFIYGPKKRTYTPQEYLDLSMRFPIPDGEIKRYSKE